MEENSRKVTNNQKQEEEEEETNRRRYLDLMHDSCVSISFEVQILE